MSKNDWRTPRGTHDRLPDAEPLWRHVLRIIEKRADGFGFGRIETPIFEDPAVFSRSLGEATDIVEKEMFAVGRMTDTKDEGNSEAYALRPENTAAIIRAYIEHGMHTWPQPVKLWYAGPMFRAERPQKGRYRQFWQAGFEIIGDDDPAADAILMYLFWQILGDAHLRDNIVVDINSMGCDVCRPKYKKALTAYYQPHKQELCENCQRRLEKNPLRLLDCKEDRCVELRKDAPQIIDFLCTACREHFRTVLEYLDELGITYDLTPTLVRGLDYYTRTTFEFRHTDDTRRQNTLAAGGRYDKLVEQFGGKPTPAVGFAIGLERGLIEPMQEQQMSVPPVGQPDIFVIQLGERSKKTCFSLVAQLGNEGYSALCQPTREGLKAQLHLADKAGVRYALIIGEREALDGTAILKDMKEGTQDTILQAELSDVLKKRFGK